MRDLRPMKGYGAGQSAERVGVSERIQGRIGSRLLLCLSPAIVSGLCRHCVAGG